VLGVSTILGNRLAPWVAEWYPARAGIQAQQTGPAARPDRRDHRGALPAAAGVAATGLAALRR
jgi:hypothetical protein